MKFKDIQEHLYSGGFVKRESWNDYPNRAFWCKQIDRFIVLDINNKIMQDILLDCQIMAEDWIISISVEKKKKPCNRYYWLNYIKEDEKYPKDALIHDIFDAIENR